MALKPFDFLSNAVRAKEIVTVLARNGFADLLHKLDLPQAVLKAFGTVGRDRKNQWERIRSVMEEMGPTYIKLGQLLSMRPDTIPERLIAELRKLQDEVAPESFDKIRPIVEEGLGFKIEEIFESFDEEAIAGASMAQVHFATLKRDGSAVAVKVQRPGLRKVIDADFDILIWLAKQVHERVEELRPYDLPSLAETLREGMDRELDFRIEAKSMAYFRVQNPYPDVVQAPDCDEELVSPRVLVMERIGGRNIDEIERGSPLAQRLACQGSKSLFNQIMIAGFFHADPHAGNIRVLDDGRLCFLDWGLVGHLTRRMRYGLMDLFLSFVKGNSERVVTTAISLADSGDSVDRRTMEREVMIAMRTHYDPETGTGSIGKAVLSLLYIFGRNGIDLSRDYSLMAKALLCIEETGKALDPDYNLRDEFEPVLVELLKERRSPRRLLEETQDSVMRGFDYMQHLPDELHRLLMKIEKDRLNVNLQHKGLDHLDSTISDASNKITLGIIIGCLIVGSSLIVTTKIPPFLFGYPILGLFGYLLSMILGVWVVFDILRGNK